MMDFSKWIMLAIMIVIVIFVIKIGTKIINILIMVLLLAFCWFSFFTGEGCARLSIALSGHPIIAYTTKLEKVDNISTNDTTYYRSSKDVVIDGNKQQYIKCYTKWIVRLPSVRE